MDETNSSEPDLSETDLWLKEQEKYLYADKNYQREPVEYLNIHFCFVDTTDAIVKIDTQKYLFSDSDDSVIRESTIFKMIEERRQTKYIFKEMMLFHVGLESFDMHNYAKCKENEYNFVETYQVVRDVLVPPSIFIFQPVNCLLILMKERMPAVLKSALKTGGGTKKRVQFRDDLKKTRRQRGLCL
jgi:hypothetical protein